MRVSMRPGAHPGWPRRVMGLLLILASLVLGMVTVRAADERRPVVLAARDLTPGVAIAPDDVTVEWVHLGSAASAYVIDPHEVIGQVASTPVAAGQLVPVMSKRAMLPVVALALRTLNLPALKRGDAVDVWSGSESAPPRLVMSGAVVAEVGPPSGAMSSVALAIPEEYVPTLLAAAENPLLAVVRR